MHDPIAYTYEASEHCPECAFKRFGIDEYGTVPEDVIDREGNPIGAVAPWQAFETRSMVCGTCYKIINELDEGER